MRWNHLIWALLCVGCGGDQFSASAGENTDGGVETGGRSSGSGGEQAGGSSGSTGSHGGSPGASGGSGGTSSAGEGNAGDSSGGDSGGTGGSDHGGAGGIDAGGAGGADIAGGSGGTDNTGGAAGNGGAGGSGCELVTHENGTGQTWQDCVPLETYDVDQARKACEAWCEASGCIEVNPGAPCWTSSSCGDNVVLGQVDTGSDDVIIAWSRTSKSLWQVTSGGFCTSAGTWK